MKDKQVWSNLQLVTELGLTIACPIIIAVLLGAYLDKRFGQSGVLTVVLLLFGVSGGLLGAYRLIKKAANLESDHKVESISQNAEAKQQNHTE